MTVFTQLIDFDGNFMPTVEKWMKEEGFQHRGFDYSVVTVLGCQSSGKSTLLNEIFGTTFEVMDASQGRNQTTKGLWLGRDKEDFTLIIDVEGTDSKERGEDRLTFEHRAALFSLALADIVVVNMWYHDLGRYTASNYGLLKTVLGVNLELFQQQANAPKTIMMFVIRDYSERQTPIETLKQMIQSDIRAIWKETTKPEHLRDSTADDFFIFKTVGLSSKFEDPNGFTEQCLSIRKTWFTELRPKAYSRQIPADGFGMYCKSVWETILRSSELDIPSQREMLATYRCEELKNVALAEILPSVSTYLIQAQKGFLPTEDFTWAIKLVEKALELYDCPAGRYQKSVFLKKREQLLQSLQTELQKVIDAHLTHVRHSIASGASTALDSLFRSNYESVYIIGGLPKLECWIKFSETTDIWKKEAIEKFEKMASSLSLTYGNEEDGTTRAMEFDNTHSRQALLESLESTLLRMRERQQHDFAKTLGAVAANCIGDVDVYLGDPELTYKTFWESITNVALAAKEEVMELLGDSWFGLQANREHELWDVYASQEVLRQLRTKLDRICEWLQNHIFTRFQLFFDQDEQGVPRQWQELSSDKIKEIYLQAREKGLGVLEIFETVGLSIQQIILNQPGFEKQILSPLLSEAKKQQVFKRASRQMQKSCQEAQLIQATGGRGINIPWWMWGLLLAFGYNEISIILFSPIALILLILGIVVGFISYYTGNIQSPMQLSRYLVGMFATAVMSFIGSLQQPPTLQPTFPAPKKQEIKKEE